MAIQLIERFDPRDIKGVAIDLDGVALHSSYMQVDSDMYMRPPFGPLSLQQRGEISAVGLMGENSNIVNWPQYRNAGPTRIWRESFPGRIDEQEEFRIKCAEEIAYLIGKSPSVTLMPGFDEFIDENSSRDLGSLPLTLVTSSDERIVQAVIKRFNLEDVFMGTISHAQAGRNKPLPDPYLASAKIMGIDPRTQLCVEDTQSGVAASIESGSISAVFDTTHSEADILGFDPTPHVILNTHEDLTELIFA